MAGKSRQLVVYIVCVEGFCRIFAGFGREITSGQSFLAVRVLDAGESAGMLPGILDRRDAAANKQL
jgi:hypothetical protein